MDHAYIDEKSLIDRYVRGTLPVAERSRFEEHFMDCQPCLEQLEIAKSLREALRGSAAEPAAVPQAAGSEATRRLTPGFWGWRWVAAAATAGMVIAAVTGVALYRSLERTRMELGRTQLAFAREAEIGRKLAQGAAQDPPLIVALNPVRGSSERKAIEIPREPRWVLFSMELDTSQFAAYRANLRNQAGQVIWQQENLLPVSPGAIAIPLLSTSLAPGVSTVSLEGRDASGRYTPIYSFAIEAKAPR